MKIGIKNNTHKTYYIIYNKLSLHCISTIIDVHQASLPLKTENVEYALSRPRLGMFVDLPTQNHDSSLLVKILPSRVKTMPQILDNAFLRLYLCIVNQLIVIHLPATLRLSIETLHAAALQHHQNHS